MTSIQDLNTGLWYIYSIGGTNPGWWPALSNIFQYNITGDEWTVQTDNLNHGRLQHGCLARKNKIYVHGGKIVNASNDYEVTDTIEVCDINNYCKVQK